MAKSGVAGTTVIKCGMLYDGIHDELFEKREILIRENRIEKVGTSVCGDDALIIDLSDKTVTPGLIDAHVHLSYFDWREKRKENIFNSPAYKTLAVLRSAQKAMARGFTSIRHVGCSSFDGYGSIDVKRTIEKGYFDGPRLMVAPMYLGVNGGPADHSQALKTNFMMAEAMRDHYRSIGCGADFFCNAVREQQKLGADFIKVMVSGSFYSPDSDPDMIYFTDEELKAIIETAHSLRMKVTAQVYGPEAMQKLAKMGIDCMEHGALMDAPTVRVIEKCGTVLVPTFFPYDVVASPNPLPSQDHQMSFKLAKYAERLKEGRKHILNSNIKLGYGSDIVFQHNNYDCGNEYSCWLRSGTDPFRALKAATSINAEIIGIKDVGRIEEGAYADIAAWSKDILTDHRALMDCAFVMKNGRTYPTESSLDGQ